MKLYLVRHGETAFSSEHRHNRPDIELTELGHAQARAAADRLRRLGVALVLTSPFVRARQTAEIVADTLGVPLLETALLEEVRRPSEVLGRTSDDPEVARVDMAIAAHGEDPAWHFSDEENFFERRERAEAFLRFLEDRDEEAVAAVSHGGMMRMILFTMMFGRAFTPAMAIEGRKRAAIANASISVCERLPDGSWKVVSVNDGTSLGET